jgi:hypothetical protein
MRNKNNDDYETQQAESPDVEFRVNNGRVIACLVISTLVCLGSASLIALGFFYAFPEPAFNMRVAAVLLGTCGLVLFLILFATNWKKYGQRLVVFSDGFRFQRAGRWSIVQWDNIDAVWQRSTTINGSRSLLETDLWIQLKDGKTIYLTSFFLDMERLVTIVLDETARRMVPDMWSRIQNGQAVIFGKVTMSATELMASAKALAWEDVEEIRVAHGGINVRRKGANGSWHYTPVNKMPNYHVFLSLADMVLRPIRKELS